MGGAHPAHDKALRRAYHRGRGDTGIKHRLALYEILGYRAPVPATAERV
jgi:hypothetical protein